MNATPTICDYTLEQLLEEIMRRAKYFERSRNDFHLQNQRLNREVNRYADEAAALQDELIHLRDENLALDGRLAKFELEVAALKTRNDNQHALIKELREVEAKYNGLMEDPHDIRTQLAAVRTQLQEALSLITHGSIG